MHPAGMHRRAVGFVAIVVGLSALAACGGDPAPPESPSPAHAIGVRWSAVPVRVVVALVARAVTACRAEAQTVAPGTPLVLVDARGADRLTLLFADLTTESECTVLVDGGGAMTFGGGGGGSTVPNLPPAPNAAQIGSMSTQGTIGVGGATDSISSATGRAGADVADVDLIASNGQRIRATTANGWFLAWWPTAETNVQVQALAVDGRPLGPAHP
jgi:hypothetical protein